MKGKKFDAHEKHFKEKEIKYSRDINHLNERINIVNDQNLRLTKENIYLSKEKIDLAEKYEKLLEYSKLTDMEIKEAIRMDKSVNMFSSMFNAIGSIL